MNPRALFAPILLAACVSSPSQRDVPAVLYRPSADAREELRTAVGTALGVEDVTLADDALTDSAALTIERIRPRLAAGRQPGGRDLDRPQRFLLVKNGPRCLLIHEDTGNRIELAGVRCEPAPP